MVLTDHDIEAAMAMAAKVIEEKPVTTSEPVSGKLGVIAALPQPNGTAAVPAITTSNGTVRLDQVPALVDQCISAQMEVYRLERELRLMRRPRHPALRWLFNLISTDAPEMVANLYSQDRFS